MREIAFVAEDKEKEWTLYDDRGCELDHTRVRFNRETGHFEAEPRLTEDGLETYLEND